MATARYVFMAIFATILIGKTSDAAEATVRSNIILSICFVKTYSPVNSVINPETSLPQLRSVQLQS